MMIFMSLLLVKTVDHMLPRECEFLSESLYKVPHDCIVFDSYWKRPVFSRLCFHRLFFILYKVNWKFITFILILFTLRHGYFYRPGKPPGKKTARETDFPGRASRAVYFPGRASRAALLNNLCSINAN